jgi:hypothetical protein
VIFILVVLVLPGGIIELVERVERWVDSHKRDFRLNRSILR